MNRQAVQPGLHEKRSGMVRLGHHEFCCGTKLWEKKHPEMAQGLWKLAASHSWISCPCASLASVETNQPAPNPFLKSPRP